ncbi:MAG: hypothetical protein ACK4UN_19845, partial [Limisphaerales bacterium]
ELANSHSHEGVTLQFSGEVGRTFTLQSSADLSIWADHLTFTNTHETNELTVPLLPEATNRFYRAVLEQ